MLNILIFDLLDNIATCDNAKGVRQTTGQTHVMSENNAEKLRDICKLFD